MTRHENGYIIKEALISVEEFTLLQTSSNVVCHHSALASVNFNSTPPIEMWSMYVQVACISLVCLLISPTSVHGGAVRTMCGRELPRHLITICSQARRIRRQATRDEHKLDHHVLLSSDSGVEQNLQWLITSLTRLKSISEEHGKTKHSNSPGGSDVKGIAPPRGERDTEFTAEERSKRTPGYLDMTEKCCHVGCSLSELHGFC